MDITLNDQSPRWCWCATSECRSAASRPSNAEQHDRQRFREHNAKLLVVKKAKIALRILEPMWFGYAIEAIYTMLGTVLIAIVVGILIYH
jgi:hypothetical protein